MNFDGAAEFDWNSYKLFEAAGCAFGIGDVTREKCAAAIEFKVEVACVGLGLEEKFHATVFPDFIAVSRSHAAHISVFDFENSVNSGCIVKQANLSARAMLARFLAKEFYFQSVGSFPEGTVPISRE